METIGTGIVDRTQDGPVGLRGWLLVFLALALPVACIGIFAGMVLIFGPPDTADFFTGAFSLSIGVLFFVDAILILLRKRLAKNLSIGICGLSAIGGALEIAAYISGFMQVDLAEGVAAARNFVLSSMWLLYFMRSRRVQYTLVD